MDTTLNRTTFEAIAKDMGLDITPHPMFDVYVDARAQLAWRMWNLALEQKGITPDPEPPVVILDIHKADFYFAWSQYGIGVGELSIAKNEDGTIGCMNEAMSKRWVRRALHSAIDTLVDATTLDD